MNKDWISALAREYAEELSPGNKAGREMIELDCLGFLDRVLNSYCLVEKSKATDLCRLTLEHDQSVDYGLIDGLTDIVLEVFPEQYHQVAEELSNPEIAKEVEG